MNSIGVVGGGAVGAATVRAFQEHVDEVHVFDPLPDRRTTEDLDLVFSSKLVFICVPTDKDGMLDTTVLEGFLESVPSTHRWANIVIRSTVPVGFTRRMVIDHHLTSLTYSPEFLTERCARTEVLFPERLVIGYTDGWLPEQEETSTQCQTVLHDLYTARYPGVQIIITRVENAEAYKLATNALYATKVALFNELEDYCQHSIVHWGSLHALLASDPRIGPAHTRVPGPDGKYGFGGKCLPKDLAGLVDLIERSGASAPVLRAVMERNKLDRRRGSLR